MAITSVLGGQGRISDATLTAMLNSGDQNLINQANNYIEGARKEAEELGKNKGILGVISDLFGFSKLAAAEPDMPSSQKFSEQNPSLLDVPGYFGADGRQGVGAMDRETPFGDRLQPQIPSGGSIFSNRQFGNIRAGQPELGIFGVPEVQDMPVDLEELAALDDDIIEQQLAAASRGEGETFFDRLRDVGGNVLDFIKGGGFIGRGITSLANTLGDTFRGSRFYNPRGITGQRIFAPGSRVGDPIGLNMRRDANRISRMLQRGAAGKNFSQKNLDNLLGKFGITGVDTGGMMDSIAESAQTGYGGYGSRSAAAEAAASGGRDYSSSPGAMAGDMEYGEE